ncbi:MAG: hypothetical protein BWX80_03944 [Candidatus Hydrogenedentes bacterium ADurb.Bin101]|nr:MAG: hypothetical protein BWX80_03944 [Candidatus Hydrogenedentes bacterium ADurb.Bin101]
MMRIGRLTSPQKRWGWELCGSSHRGRSGVAGRHVNTAPGAGMSLRRGHHFPLLPAKPEHRAEGGDGAIVNR